MILVELKGGLGNQMFQYAFAKALSLEYRTELYVVKSFLLANEEDSQGFTSRKYELGVFDAGIRFASDSLVSSFEQTSLLKTVLRIIGLPYRKCFEENRSSVSEQLGKIVPPVLLKGYWQSEKYFKKFETEIRKEFTFNFDKTGYFNNGDIRKIKRMNAVAVHFRRGDYVSNPVASRVLGALDLAYYDEAVRAMTKKVNDPFFFLFSDDPQWVRENFRYPKNSQFIESNANQDAHFDLYMMTKCKHNIIANSTYSWWGAWLNSNRHKTVIAPKSWFRDKSFANNDLISPDWLCV
jgi:hypothetical protein